MTTKAMVILSGGQDSTTCLFWAKQHFDEVHAVTFDYGQKHRIEIGAACVVAQMAGVASHEIIEVPGILQGRSPLIDQSVELERYTDFASMDATIGDRVELTFVPMRNLLFIVLAANRAICKDIRDLVTGVCQADNANYPDCRESFVMKAEDAISYALGLDRHGMGPLFEVHTPLMDMSKAQSVGLAQTLPGCMEALAHSHTAYDGRYPPNGSDHASILRAHGFEEAGVPDPLVVRAWREGLMPLPRTANYAALQDATDAGMILWGAAHAIAG
jgi:7-cyano-7-deazaguanine synthase